jgi:transposase
MIPAVIERCAGIDVGKKFLAVCVMTGPAKDDAQAVRRKFGTVRRELEELRKWLQSEGCTHVVMENSGVYWKPVLNVLEDDPQYSLKILKR